MKIDRYFYGLLLLASSFLAEAKESEIILGFEFGQSSSSIDPRYRVYESDFDSNGYAAGLILGFRFASNVVVEGNYSFASNDRFFRQGDHYSLREARLMLGYSIGIGSSLRFVPMAGYSRWSLRTQEGRFLNPGPEEEFEFEGTDLIYKARFDVPVGKLVVLSLSYANAKLDYGRNDMTQIGVKFEF